MEIDFSIFKKNNGPLTHCTQKAAKAPSTSPVQVAAVAYGGSLLMALALALLFKFLVYLATLS